MSKFKLAIILLFSLSCFLGACSQDSKHLSSPYVKVLTETKDYGTLECSGVFTSEGTFLTARHCFAENSSIYTIGGIHLTALRYSKFSGDVKEFSPKISVTGSGVAFCKRNPPKGSIAYVFGFGQGYLLKKIPIRVSGEHVDFQGVNGLVGDDWMNKITSGYSGSPLVYKGEIIGILSGSIGHGRIVFSKIC